MTETAEQLTETAGHPVPGASDKTPSPRQKLLARILSLVVIVGALVAGVYMLIRGEMYPSTDDASVQANYISVSAEVPGRIAVLAVKEGQAVAPGDLLLQIDPRSYEFAVEAATLQVKALEAQITESERQRKAAMEQVQTARANMVNMVAQEALAQSTYERMGPLMERGFVTREEYDMAATRLEQTRAGVAMAKSTEASAELMVPLLDILYVELAAAKVRLAQTMLELERTQVRAEFHGRVVGCRLAVGQMVAPGIPLFTLVDTAEWFVVANYREGDLRRIQVGDSASVVLMTLPGQTFRGEVVTIGHAVQTQNLIEIGPLPFVRNELDWVRLAQRFPVRIRIEQPEPQEAFRIGASATVVIRKQ